jgi:hypothetical protein
MRDENKEFPELNSMFGAANIHAARPSDDLMARVSEEAARVQAGFHKRPAKPDAPGMMAQLFRVLGGWPAMGGLALATATGVWIGISPPSTLLTGVSQVAQVYLGTDDTAYLIDIEPGSEFDLGEEAL